MSVTLKWTLSREFLETLAKNFRIPFKQKISEWFCVNIIMKVIMLKSKLYCTLVKKWYVLSSSFTFILRILLHYIINNYITNYYWLLLRILLIILRILYHLFKVNSLINSCIDNILFMKSVFDWDPWKISFYVKIDSID